MDLKNALDIITKDSERFPEEAVAVIKENIDAAIPELLNIISRPLTETAKTDLNILPALFLLSEFHVKEAFPYVAEYLRMDDETVDLLIGDAQTENLHVITANIVSEETMPELKDIIESEETDCFSKGAALHALFVLCARGELEYEALENYCTYLLETYPEDDVIVTELACSADELCSKEMRELILKAFDNGIIDEQMIDRRSFRVDSILGNKQEKLKSSQHYKAELGTVEDMKTWACYTERDSSERGSENYKELFGKLEENYSFYCYVIKAKPVDSFRQAIDLLEDHQLSIIFDQNAADDDVIDSYGEIKDFIYNKLTDYNTFCRNMLTLNLDNEVLIRRCAESATPLKYNGGMSKYVPVVSKGILIIFEYEGNKYVVMTEEHRALYQRYIAEDMPQHKRDIQQIKQYADAAMNLYGVIPVKKFIELYRSYTQSKLSDEYITDRIIDGLDFPEQFSEETGFLMTKLLIGSPESRISKLRRLAAGDAPLYIPKKHEFLRYSDADFCGDGDGIRQMRKNLRLSVAYADKNVLDCVVSDLYDIIMGVSMHASCLSVMEYYDIGFNDMESESAFIRLYNEMDYTTRKWENRGFTDKELRPREKYQPVKKVKIGRNAPCPCGSGKKYKKCCGR